MSDPDHPERYLSVPTCAAALGVTPRFIRDEVQDGRLLARVLRRESGRSVYRIAATAFQAYMDRYWPEKRSTCNKEASNL